MGGGDIRGVLRLGGKKTAPDIIEAGILFKEASRHLWLARKAAEIDYRPRMGNGLGTDGTGILRSVGDRNTALRRAGWAGVLVGNTQTRPIRVRKGDSN